MPTDQTATEPDRALAARRVLRLALGRALRMWISQAGGWTLSYIAPILTLSLLALPMSRPRPKLFVIAVLAIVVSIYGSFLFLPVLIHQRAAGLLLLSLALFHSFYFTARGGAAVVGTLVTIGLTLTVAVGSVSVDGLIAVAQGVTIGALVGAAIAGLCHGLLPDPPERSATSTASSDASARPPREAAVRNAMRSMAIVLPVTIWFILSSASAANAAVMIKVAAMGQEAASGEVRNAARSLVVSTLAGGLAAVIAWQILTVWPSLTMYIVLIGMASLIFGQRIFAGPGLHADAATWSYALLTMIVILAPAALDSQFGSAAGARFYDRLLMFMGASIYGVVAVYLFDALWPGADRLGAAQPGHARIP